MRQLIPPFAARCLHWLWVMALCLYFTLGALALVLRYAVLPQIDQWRPWIAGQLTTALGVRVELGSVDWQWRGWSPDLTVREVRLTGPNGQSMLQIPQVKAQFSWSGLLPGRAGVLHLRVEGMDVAVDRLPDGQVRVLGQTVRFAPQGVQDAGATAPLWLQWVLGQPYIAFRNVTVRWRDQLRGAPELDLTDIEAVMQRTDHQALGLYASARAQVDGGAQVVFGARVPDVQALVTGNLPQGSLAWLQTRQVRVNDWRPWVDVPASLQRGEADVQLWLQAQETTAQLTLQAQVANLELAQAQESLRVLRAQSWLQGPIADWGKFVSGAPTIGNWRVQSRMQGADLRLPRWFDGPLSLGLVSLRGQISHARDWSVTIDHARWLNADADVELSGAWRSTGGVAGYSDFGGTIHRASLAAIHRYLPKDVDADARQWLATGLPAGQLRDGTLLLRGDVAEFPFSEHPLTGDFRVDGTLENARVNFVPDAAPRQAWPPLDVIAGTADLHRMDLRLTASDARMAPVSGQVIQMRAVQARIPDLEHDATLQVSGQSTASGSTYMALIRHSPLRRMLNGVFDEARAQGQWNVPIALTVPLLRAEQTQVDGRVELQNAALQFLPQAPVFQALSGDLTFNEDGVRIDKPLRGRLLGGPVQVRGTLGSAKDKGLSFQGQVTAEAAARYVGVPGMGRLSGTMDYQARLAPEDGAYVFTLESDTQGLALDFPAPLAKPAGQVRRLAVRWSDELAQDDQLEIRYGDAVRVSLLHRRKQASGPYFQNAAVGLGLAGAQGVGMHVAIAYPLFDLDVWNRLVDEFAITRRGHDKGKDAQPRALWPDLASLSIQADQLRMLGTRLDHAALRVVRAPGEQWSMNVRSTQTTGTLKWQELAGRVQGQVSGSFSRLSLGDDPRNTDSLLPEPVPDDDAHFDEDLEIPAVVLHADDFRLYGRPVGKLSLEGTRDAAAHVWRLTRLRMGDDDVEVQGTGVWQLRGSQRGLSLQADVKAKDLGAWMARAGWPDVLVGGTGELKGRFEWHNLAWTRDKADLQGQLTIALDKGRFPRLGSHTAKLLELLSLQSIARLPKLDQGLTSLLHQGVVFDQLRGQLTMAQGKVQVGDYKVIGPLGTVVLEGSSNILQETLDLQAVVVPNLDVSGAAVAAGIAINPLIGLGAFITQWLLKTPLAKAMTARYRITGSWDDPKIQEVPLG